MSTTTYEKIEKLCKEHGIAITKLEAELGFGRGSIGKLKKGGSCSADRLAKIADYFHVPLEELRVVTFKLNQDAYQKMMDNIRDSIAPGLSDVTNMYISLSEQDRREIYTLMKTKMEKYVKKELLG